MRIEYASEEYLTILRDDLFRQERPVEEKGDE
jgi:hypothetical protein